MVDADGGSPQPVSSGQMSDSFEIAWSPDSHILYQQAGNRNFYVLNPQTRQERLLLKDGSVGWMFNPVYSPDGKKIAVTWNRRPNFGIWLIDSHTARETSVYNRSNPLLIGWSADGTSIYALEGKGAIYRGLAANLGETVTEAKILRIPLDGGEAEAAVVLPFEEVGGVSMTPDGKFICTVYSSRSDVWVVENFDVSPEGASEPAPRVPGLR
jgi:Tol biopolymer transport system component